MQKETQRAREKECGKVCRENAQNFYLFYLFFWQILVENTAT